MKRSRAVNLILLTSSVAALESCNRQQCIDRNNIVVDDRYCQGQAPAGSYGYRWYVRSGSSGSVGVGGHVDPSSGTAHGVFGSAGDAAGGGGDAGAGE
ncbi:MAG TPA: hypothetical protein VGL82_13810 [Bryobacteraceae bacterium]